jgi:hypothetical protein
MFSARTKDDALSWPLQGTDAAHGAAQILPEGPKAA